MELPTNPLESFRKRNSHLYPAPAVAPENTKSAVHPQKCEFSHTSKAVPVFSCSPSNDEVKLNKTERARLGYLRCCGQEVGIQAVTLKLGDDCRFTPDFNYITTEGRMVFEDVKGFQRDDALVKIKVAARKFNWATFLIVKKDKTGWAVTEIKP